MTANDGFNAAAREGPCLDCYRSGQPVVNQDLTRVDGRWPNFARFAVESGFRAADAIPMRLRGQVVGVLNLFRNQTGSLSAADVTVAQALADIAIIAILQHRHAAGTAAVNDQLQIALDSRILIEQANGMIAEREQIPVADAYVLLRSHARNHNRRLVEVARDVIENALTIPAAARPVR